MYIPIVQIHQSYDATTHFESTVEDVLNMYTLITGKVWKKILKFLNILSFATCHLVWDW